MDILIDMYSYSYIRATNKQGNSHADPQEYQLWTDNTYLPLKSLLVWLIQYPQQIYIPNNSKDANIQN